MNLFDIINLKCCVCFICIHKWTKSICFHQVLSEKNQWVLTHKSIRIRKHQRGAEIRSLFPPSVVCPWILWLIILYRNLDFESYTPTAKTVSRMIFPLSPLSSAWTLLSSSTQLPIPTSVLWFPTTHPPLIFSHYTFFGMSFSTFVNSIHLPWLNSNTPLPSIGSSLRSDHPSTWKSLMASQCSEGRVFRFLG